MNKLLECNSVCCICGLWLGGANKGKTEHSECFESAMHELTSNGALQYASRLSPDFQLEFYEAATDLYNRAKGVKAMRDFNFNPVIIFSVFSYKFDAETNLQTHQHVKNKLIQLGIVFKEVVGSYKGSEELSLVVTDSPKNRDIVTQIANSTAQESILIRDNKGFATLVYLASNESEFLGQFVQVYESEAKQLESWTYDSANKQYYAIK